MAMRYQPQGLLRLARTPLAAGLRLAVLPGVNQGFNAVSRQFPIVTGTKPAISGSSAMSGFGATFGAASSDRVETGLSGAFSATGRSYFVRARRNGSGGLALGRLLDKTGASSSGQFLYWRNSAGLLSYGYFGGGSERTLTIPGTDVTAAIGSWFEVLVTHAYDGAGHTFNVWVNGEQVVSGAASSNVINDNVAADFVIGNRTGGARGWDGLIECAYVWDRVLTADDAAALAQNRYHLFNDPSEEDDLIAAAAPNNYTLTAAPGTFGLSGSSASLRATRKLAGGNGSFSLTGNPATLRAGRRVAGATGVITLAGSAVNLRAVRRLAAAAGAFALTGGDAQLVFSAVAEGATIVTSSGQFVLAGSAVGMRVTRRLQAQAGSFELTGSAAAIRYLRRISAAPGEFTASSGAAVLRAVRRLAAAPGGFNLLGNSATLTYGATVEYARAPAGSGYTPNRNEYQSRPVQPGSARPAAIQRNRR